MTYMHLLIAVLFVIEKIGNNLNVHQLNEKLNKL